MKWPDWIALLGLWLIVCGVILAIPLPYWPVINLAVIIFLLGYIVGRFDDGLD